MTENKRIPQKEDQRTSKNIEAVISKLNEHLDRIAPGTHHCFVSISNGYATLISFEDYVLWSTEEDDREHSYLDKDENEIEYEEALYNHVARKFNEYVECLRLFKFPKSIVQLKKDEA